MNKIFFSLIFALFLTLSSFSQNSSIAKTDGNLFSISGSVISKPEKNLLSNTTVKFQKFTTNPVELMKSPILSIQTDANGRWSFDNLSAGDYKIIFSPPSIQSKSDEKGDSPQLASVTKMFKIENKDIRDLIIELPIESTISGKITVKGKNQNPEFSYIIATDESRAIVSGSEINEKNFHIKNLSEGNFFLNLTVDASYHVQAIKLGNEDITDSTINLKDGQNIKNVEVVVSNEVGNIKGKINGFNSGKGILIVLLPIRESAQNSLRSSFPEVADENGEFNIEAPPGEYFVAIVTQADMARRDQNKLEEWFKEITRNAQKVIVSSNETVNLELNLPK